MKPNLMLACLICLPAAAQMPMQMPMNGTPEHARSAPVIAKKPATPKALQQPVAPETPVMPFGKVADGDTSTAPRQVPEAPTPVVLGTHVQEQEHPERRTGSSDPAVADVFEDVDGRAPEPLQYFVSRAAANNPTLQQAEAQVRRLRADAKQAGLWQNPEIGYEADHVRGGSYHSGEQGGYIQQVIPLGGQRSSARAAGEASAEAAEAILTAQRQSVSAAVEQAFYAALVWQREVALRSQLASLASDNARAAHQFANIGQADAPDVLQNEVEREKAKLEFVAAQREYRKAFATLAAVSGDAGMAVTPLQGDLTAVPALVDVTASTASEQSPSLQAALQQASAQDAAIRSARRQALPELTLHAGMQQDNEPLESARGRVGVVGVAQAGVTLPLWNRNQGAVKAAEAQKTEALAEVKRTQLTLHMRAEQALQDYANAMGQATMYRNELLPRAERAMQLYRQKYAAMAASYPQRMLSERMLLQLEIEYARALGTAWQNAILLQRGLLQGGLAAPELIRSRGGAGAE